MGLSRFLDVGVSFLSCAALLLACSSRKDEATALRERSQAQTQSRSAFELDLGGAPVRLVLRSAPLAAPSTYRVWEPTAAGTWQERTATVPSCLYEADVYDASTNQLLSNSYASVSTCLRTHGYAEPTLSGLIVAYGRSWSIEPVAGDSDVADGIAHRLLDNDALRLGPDAGSPSEASRGSITQLRRSTAVVPQLAAFREGTAAETKYIELVVANDAERLELFKGDSDAMLSDSIAIITAANTIFANTELTPRIRLAVVGQVNVPADAYPVVTAGPGQVNSEALLEQFGRWATANVPPHDDHCLLSGHDFNGNTVGLAYLAAMCTGERSGLIAQTKNVAAAAAEIVVHELGHNLGMPHDSDGNACPGSGYLMAAVATNGGLNNPQFSSCSAEYYSSFLTFMKESGIEPCLDDMPTDLALDQCGDGVVSGTEQCDCGGKDCAGIDPCCDGNSCQLTAGAACSDFNDACCLECQLAPKAQVCRPARDACDTEELCNGFERSCPGDRFSASGVSCNVDEGQAGTCYGGRCVSRDQQCRALSNTLGLSLAGPGPDCTTPLTCGGVLCNAVDYGSDVCVVVEGLDLVDGVGCGDSRQCLDGDCVDSSTIDDCPADPDKTLPGTCGCGVADTDSDQDNTPDCADFCPDDAAKLEPGTCGCGKPEPNATGITSCEDTCPTNIDKEAPGVCGCDVADTDRDADGNPDCMDACPDNPNPLATAANGCVAPPATGGSSGDGDGNSDGDDTASTGDDGGDGAKKKDKKGCGCRIEAHHERPPASAWLPMLTIFCLYRLRRRTRPLAALADKMHGASSD